MNFRNLPKYLQDAVVKLTSDNDFQYRFGHDKILDELDELEKNKADEYLSLQILLHNKFTINGRTYSPITLAMWSFLYAIDSPIVNSDKEITSLDVDLFFYILENGVNFLNLTDLMKEAYGYVNKLNIGIEDALQDMAKIIKVTFQPLSLFPKVAGGSNKVMFDADWVTALATKVYHETGYSIDYIINTLSLHACCYYFAQYKREQGADQIYKRSPEDILRSKDRRASELIVDYLVEKGIMPKGERDKWLNEIITPPQKNK